MRWQRAQEANYVNFSLHNFRCQQKKPTKDVKLFMLRDDGTKWIYVNFLTAVEEVNMEWA